MSGAEDGGPRRYLISVAVAEYPKHREWDRPELVAARDRVTALFTGLGYHHADCVPANPTKRRLTDALNEFCTSAERREDDLLAVYLSCHGEVLESNDEHVLLTADTDPQRRTYTSLPTAELTRALVLDTRVRRVLLMLDACYVGLGGDQLAAAALERLGQGWGASAGSGLVVVSSAQPHQQAVAGLFPELLADAVHHLAVAGHGPDTLSVNSVVQHMNDSPDRPAYQRVSLSMLGLDGEPPGFLPNPRHDARLNAVDLSVQREAAFDEQDRRRETEFVNRLLIRAMGYHQGAGEGEPGWWFSGRHAALTELAAWLDGDSPCQAVTAGPGSGKTAVLGLVAALTHPERHRTVPLHALGLPAGLFAPGALDAAVYAQRLTDADVLDALCAAARVRAGTVGTFLEELERQPRARPLTVLIDALDEAATPESLCAAVLRPLLRHAGGRVRLLLGTRPYLLPRLHLADDRIVDLDAPRYADPDALAAYAARTLLRAHRGSPYRRRPSAVGPVAREVARAAGHSFLVARITAGTLAAAPAVADVDDPAWRAALPRRAGDAMRADLRRRLGPDAARAADLLRPLAHAQGQGLPWEDLWAPLAAAIAGRPYHDEDVVWLRRNAGSYVVEATEDGRSAYRLYHEALAEHLREGVGAEAVHAAYARVLTERLPCRADGTPDWSRAHPYALHHLAHHAAGAGRLDEVLGEGGYLVHAVPRGLTPYLRHARSDTARLNAAVYRTGLHLHHDAEPSVRRQVLALEAARAGAHGLRREFVRHLPPGTWTPAWATGSTFGPALRDTLTGHTGAVEAVACAVLDGRPVAVTGGKDDTVRVWDLTTGQPVGEPLTGHTGSVDAVACTVLDGRPVAVTGSWDNTVRVWDLATGQPVGEPLTGHTGPVDAVACTVLDERPVAVTGSWDNTVRVWDLTTGQPVGEPLTGHTSPVDAVACTVLDGRPIAVTGDWNHTARVWDLATGQPVEPPPTAPASVETYVVVDGALRAVTVGPPVRTVMCTLLDGRPVAVSIDQEHTVRVWDLSTGEPVGPPLDGHTSSVKAVACTTLEGRPVAVTGSRDGTARVWDLDTGEPVGSPLDGHTSSVKAVACTTLEGRPVAVTGSQGDTARAWDLDTGQPVNGSFATENVFAMACTVIDGRAAVLVSPWGEKLEVRDLGSGRLVAEWPDDRVDVTEGLACAALPDGRPVAVTGSWNGTVRVRDLATGEAVGDSPARHTSRVNAVACTVLDGRPVAVTGSWDETVRVWDLATGQSAEEPFVRHDSPVASVACAVLDGRPVVAAGSWDGAVHLWDLATGEALGSLVGHTDTVEAVACTVLDGRPVAASCSSDNTVRLWDLQHRTALAVIRADAPAAVAFASDGSLVVGFHNDVACFRREPRGRARPAGSRYPRPS
ncbi:caspase family protein [Kitasatospora sp. NPDC057198]|uniref:caspase family protein n=1 Tax=Kitasatospora sp. NPDC057198 TaxID=3346046 RepID=UPI00363A7666